MTVICAAEKNGLIAIASDSLRAKSSNLLIPNDNLRNPSKLLQTETGVIGFSGWDSSQTIMRHLLAQDFNFKFGSEKEIVDTLLQLQPILKNKYYVNTAEFEDQPCESNQMNVLLINHSNIYKVSSMRNVTKMERFWAIGSGEEFSLGAMEVVYGLNNFDAIDIVVAGVETACKYSTTCAAPVSYISLEKK